MKLSIHALAHIPSKAHPHWSNETILWLSA